MTTHKLGQYVDVETTFRDKDQELADPSTVVAEVIDPDGVRTWPETTNDPDAVGLWTWSSGELSKRGRWRWRIVGAGAVAVVDHGAWDVEDVIHDV